MRDCLCGYKTRWNEYQFPASLPQAHSPRGLVASSRQPVQTSHFPPPLSVRAMGTSLGLCVSPSEFKALGPYFLICEEVWEGYQLCVSQQMGPRWYSETQCVPVGGHSGWWSRAPCTPGPVGLLLHLPEPLLLTRPLWLMVHSPTGSVRMK